MLPWENKEEVVDEHVQTVDVRPAIEMGVGIDYDIPLPDKKLVDFKKKWQAMVPGSSITVTGEKEYRSIRAYCYRHKYRFTARAEKGVLNTWRIWKV